MAEITRRRTGELRRKLFNILMAAPDGVQASAALQALASRVPLTPYEADSYEAGGVTDRHKPATAEPTGAVA